MEMSRTFTLDGKEFQLNKIDALKQWHIVRKIGPLLSELILAMKSMTAVKADKMTQGQQLDEFAKIASPIMIGLSKLSDQDSEYVLFRLLGAVEMKQAQFNNAPARVAIDTGIMMQDLELPILLQLAGRSLAYNLSSFFKLLPRQA